MLKFIFIKSLYAVNHVKISNYAISKISCKKLIRVLSDILYFYEICPSTKNHIDLVNILDSDDEKDESSYAAYTWNDMADGGTLGLSLEYFTTDYVSMVDEISERFYINKTNSMDAVIYHELGHMLAQQIIRDNSKDCILKEIWDKHDKSEEEEKILSKLFPLTKEYIEQNITWYASTELRECFAELIAEIMTSQNPREPAQKLKEYLIEHRYFKEF